MFLKLKEEIFECGKKEQFFLVEEDSFLVEWRVEFDGRHHDRPLSLFLLQLKHRSLKIGGEIAVEKWKVRNDGKKSKKSKKKTNKKSPKIKISVNSD